jgi:predicted anti-sigma-YlaC factor YlaD
MLDGELSQLEQRMVDSHLARCAGCRDFERDVREFTTQIREAPLESPRVPVLVRRARRATLGAANVSVAAMLAVAVLGLVAQLGAPGSHSSDVGARLSTAALFSGGWKPERELATIDTRRPEAPGPFSAI